MVNKKIQILTTGIIGKSFVNQAATHDIEIDEIPFIKTTGHITPSVHKRIQIIAHQNAFIVFTSANAIKAISQIIKEDIAWKVFCVGEKTKSVFERVFGKGHILDTANNASNLSAKIIEHASIKEISFFCGNLHRKEIPSLLKKAGINVIEFNVYKTVLTPRVISKRYDAILFFSPSSVKSFFSANMLTDQTKIFAIGSTTAAEVKNFSNQPVIIPPTPCVENVMSMVMEAFGKTKIYNAKSKE